MEILDLLSIIFLIVFLVLIAWIGFLMYVIRQDMREISKSLDRIEDTMDMLMILTYLSAKKNHPQLTANLEPRAIEAGKRLQENYGQTAPHDRCRLLSLPRLEQRP